MNSLIGEGERRMFAGKHCIKFSFLLKLHTPIAIILNLPDNFDFSPEGNTGQVINGLNNFTDKMGSTAGNPGVVHAVDFLATNGTNISNFWAHFVAENGQARIIVVLLYKWATIRIQGGSMKTRNNFNLKNKRTATPFCGEPNL
jgi:hypothetical protein